MVNRSSKNLLPMIRIAITPAAYDAIRSILPQDAPLCPAERQGEQCLIHVEAAVLDRLTAMRRRGESYYGLSRSTISRLTA
jgi:hypothetical protein